MVEKVDIAPKSEWTNLSIVQLYDTKTSLTDKFYDMKKINSVYANQIEVFMGQISSLISIREEEARMASELEDDD